MICVRHVWMLWRLQEKKKCGIVSPSPSGALHFIKELQILTWNKYKTVKTQMTREFETRAGNNDHNSQSGLLEGNQS